MKRVYPKGPPEEPDKRFFEDVAMYSQDCMSYLRKGNVNGWPFILEMTMHSTIMYMFNGIDKIDKTQKEAIANCLIAKYKKLYPDGKVISVPKGQTQKLIEECIKSVINSTSVN